jgi:uncharacterized protein (TIGR02246 family)
MEEKAAGRAGAAGVMEAATELRHDGRRVGQGCEYRRRNEMTLNALGRAGLFAAVVTLSACAQQAPQPSAPPDTRAADEAAIRARINDWAAAARAKDSAKFVTFYADDAVVMLAGAPDIRGIASIRESIPGMMQDPAFALSFEAEKVEVARSGDLAYETGTYEMTMTGPDKKPATEKGHYAVVWRKGADGAWKVVIDAPVSDPPGGTAGE